MDEAVKNLSHFKQLVNYNSALKNIKPSTVGTDWKSSSVGAGLTGKGCCQRWLDLKQKEKAKRLETGVHQ